MTVPVSLSKLCCIGPRLLLSVCVFPIEQLRFSIRVCLTIFPLSFLFLSRQRYLYVYRSMASLSVSFSLIMSLINTLIPNIKKLIACHLKDQILRGRFFTIKRERHYIFKLRRYSLSGRGCRAWEEDGRYITSSDASRDTPSTTWHQSYITFFSSSLTKGKNTLEFSVPDI